MAEVLIVGAGAAGLMAAGAAARRGHAVTVLEHTDKPAQKILVTGKGRCNLTNACDEEEFLRHVRTNPRFLYSSLCAFPPAKTMELFESLGVALKVERGRRVFPVSDKAAEVRQALLDYAAGARLVHDGAASLLLEPLPQPEALPGKKAKKGPAFRCAGVRGTSGQSYRADCVLPGHRLHRRRLQAGPAGRPHHRGAGAQPGQPGVPRPGLQKDDGAGPEKRQADPF